MNINEVKLERGDLLDAAQAIIAGQRAPSATFKVRTCRNTPPSSSELKFSMHKLKKSTHSPHRAGLTPVAHSQAGTPVGQQPTGFARDTDGKRLPIFRQRGEHRGPPARQELGSSEDGEITLGGVCRAMAIGGGTPAVRNALSIGTDSAGGYTVPFLLSTQLIDRMRCERVAQLSRPGRKPPSAGRRQEQQPCGNRIGTRWQRGGRKTATVANSLT